MILRRSFLPQQQRGCSRCLPPLPHPAEILTHINTPLEVLGPSKGILNFYRCSSALRLLCSLWHSQLLCNNRFSSPLSGAMSSRLPSCSCKRWLVWHLLSSKASLDTSGTLAPSSCACPSLPTLSKSQCLFILHKMKASAASLLCLEF